MNTRNQTNRGGTASPRRQPTPNQRLAGRRQAGESQARNQDGNQLKSPNNFTLLFGLFRKHFLLLLVPMAIFTACAAAYILTRKPVWRATQTLQIRDELALQTVMPGRFNSLDMMKMVQETIHETVRRHSVVAKVLSQLDPPADYDNAEAWPSVEDVEGMQGSISLSPPNGAEFGRTEILLLSVKSESTDRAKKIVSLLGKELQFQLNELRDKRAASIENELDESVKLATDDLDAANRQLTEFEKGVGDILVDLRSVSSETGSGGTTLHSRLNLLLAEKRNAQKRFDVLAKQLENIRQAAADPDQVLSFSSELLDAQPSLKKLKEELISIQTNTAMKLGQFADYHPKAKAAIEAENVVIKKILDEVKIAESGLVSQVSVLEEQINRLEKAKKELQDQLQNLAENRASYSALLKMVDQRRKVLNKVLEDRSRATASRAAARTTNLVTLLDEPYSGSRPEGMSKKIIVGAAGFAGLMSGIGLVFFAASPSFVGPMNGARNQSETDVTLPEWKTEVLATGQINEDESLPAGQSAMTSSHAAPEMEIRKVDFNEAEDILNDEVDYEEIFGEPAEQAEPIKSEKTRSKRRVEPFKLEPRKKRKKADPIASTANDSSPDENSGEDKDTGSSSDTLKTELEAEQQDTDVEQELDELSLKEKHRRQIEDMFRDED